MYVVCWVFLCVGICTGLQCTSPQSSALKFSLRSQRNKTGHWIAQVQLGHEAGQKVAGPWEVDVDHTTAKCEDSESVLIVATVTGPSVTQKAASISSTPPHGAGYELAPGLGYYKAYQDEKTWEEARKVCMEDGAHLLIVNSEQEATYLKSLWQKIPSNWSYAFAGFHDKDEEGKYMTVLNETLESTNYVKWDIHGGEMFDCGLFGRNLMIGNQPCENKHPFFCEREL